ncbi:MAG: hypothetical protein ACFFBP_15450 [Promethearchaeota archaeon]
MEELKKYKNIFLIIIIVITIILIILRIIFYFIQIVSPSDNLFFYVLIRNRDLNFKTLYTLMDNGIFDIYKENPLTGDKMIYLYYWYFIFFPFYLIPLDISVYVWDVLRLFTTIYIVLNIEKITQNKEDMLFFFIFCSLGYFADMYLNNTNWLILLFLFFSYLQLKKERKLLSGFFFALAMFKTIIVIFPVSLIVIRKIKLKNILYYILPFVIFCIPYMINFNYFTQLVSNWLNITGELTDSIIVNFILIIWRLIQMPHLLFICLIVLIIIVNIKNDKWKRKISLFLYFSLFLIWILFWLMLLLLIILL